MLTSREATEAPRQGSRSPLSPTEVTESATVRLFLILSALLCSVNNVDLRLLYPLRLLPRSPHNAQHSTSIFYFDHGIPVHTYVHIHVPTYTYMHGTTVCQSQHEVKTSTVCQAFIMNSDERGSQTSQKKRASGC